MNFTENNTPTINKLVEIKDIAEAWGMSVSGVRDAVEKHGLPAIKIGKCLRFDVQLANEWAASRAVKATVNR